MFFVRWFFVLFWGLGPKVSQGGARDLPRVPPGSKKLQNGCQNDSKIINKCCPEAFWKRFSKTHALSMFLNSSGLFFVCSYSCRGRLSVTFIQVKSQHSSTWLGGKTYGGCLPNASQMLPDASQMPPRCFPDVSQMLPRCLPDSSWCFQMPHPSWFLPQWFLSHAPPSTIPLSWFLLRDSSSTIPPPWFLLHGSSSLISSSWFLLIS